MPLGPPSASRARQPSALCSSDLYGRRGRCARRPPRRSADAGLRRACGRTWTAAGAPMDSSSQILRGCPAAGGTEGCHHRPTRIPIPPNPRGTRRPPEAEPEISRRRPAPRRACGPTPAAAPPNPRSPQPPAAGAPSSAPDPRPAMVHRAPLARQRDRRQPRGQHQNERRLKKYARAFLLRALCARTVVARRPPRAPCARPGSGA